MVHTDVIVDKISCQQKFFLATFLEQNLTLAVTNGKYYPTFELGFLGDFEDLENVSEMVAETLETSKDQQSESATVPVKTTRVRARAEFEI